MIRWGRRPDDQGGRDQGLRPTTVAKVFGYTLVIGYLLQRLAHDQWGRFPFPSWPGAAAMVAICVGLVAAGLPIKRFRDGRLTRRLDPIWAFRVLIFARAAALTGGGMCGWYGGYALVLMPESESVRVMQGIWWCLAYVGAGVLLSGSGLLVQSWCRVDPPEDRNDLDGAGGAPL